MAQHLSNTFPASFVVPIRHINYQYPPNRIDTMRNAIVAMQSGVGKTSKVGLALKRDTSGTLVKPAKAVSAVAAAPVREVSTSRPVLYNATAAPLRPALMTPVYEMFLWKVQASVWTCLVGLTCLIALTIRLCSLSQVVHNKPQRVQQIQRQPSRVVQLPPIQRARRPQQQLVVQHQQHVEFPAWAERYRRQVRSLPQGVAALHNLLHAVDRLLQRAEHCGSHNGVMKAFLGLGLIDLTSQAWQQRSVQLQEQQNKVRLVVAAHTWLTRLSLGCILRLTCPWEISRAAAVLPAI